MKKSGIYYDFCERLFPASSAPTGDVVDAVRLLLNTSDALAPHVTVAETAEAKLAAATYLGALMKLEDCVFPGERLQRIRRGLSGGTVE